MKPFRIDYFVQILEQHYASWQPPLVTLVSNRGGSPFEILVSTILSSRTKDDVTAEASARLFAAARTPQALLALDEKTLQSLIFPVGFYVTKAKRVREVSRILLDTYGGKVPDSMDQLLTLPGVGRKTANLVLAEGFQKDAICVDTHVHRICNRLGYVDTQRPDQTETVLRRKLPRKYWKLFNKLLVAFGQVVCRPISPHCSTCPVTCMCPRIGVSQSR